MAHRPHHEEAAVLLASSPGRSRLDPVLLAAILQLIEMALPFLIRCQPSPAQAAIFLGKTDWSFWDRLLGRPQRHRRQIDRVLSRCWSGPPEGLDEVRRGLEYAARTGRITPWLLAGLYAERK